jgi:nondiscriminating glutamyl-tRNA synthetase
MTTEKPRVRFAPSPTGDLHVGNARTALFNWMFARHHGGEFLLRIEDTDPARASKDFELRILEDLAWLAIDWDEGPGRGGEKGPYHQSERLALYDHYLTKLLRAGCAYPCYCTEEELEAERAELVFRKMMPRYMGKCRNLRDSDRKTLADQGRQPSYRFRIGTGWIEFQDLIRGAMKFDAAAMGDFIIVRSNGIPAYNFACVVDDHLMSVSHVIRGEDHLSNTALQLLIYQALDFMPPIFAHHSLILGKDRSKLGKRHGSVAVREFRERGILPEVLLNYLSLLGSSLGGGREVCSLEDMISSFSLDRAGKSGAIFDEDKLKWLNGIYIRQGDLHGLTERLLPFIRAAGYHEVDTLDRMWLERVIDAVRGDLAMLSDIGDQMDIFFEDRYALSGEARQVLREEQALNVVRGLQKSLDDLPFSGDLYYQQILEDVRRKTGAKGKKLFLPIRAAVTGKTRGPELDKVFALLSRGALRRRVEAAISSPSVEDR